VLMLTQEPVRQLNQCYTSLKANAPGADRLDALIAIQPEIEARSGGLRLPTAPHRIRFENVSFAFDREQVLRDVNLEVRAGEVLGLVGPSGSGKSTLLALIARFHDPAQGRITFDGVDLKELRLPDVMAHVAFVFQEPFLFS